MSFHFFTRFCTLLFVCLFLGNTHAAWGQSNECEGFLNQLREAWRTGDVDELGKESRKDLANPGNQSQLRKCLASLKGEDKLEAYAFLIIFHLYRDENRQAESRMKDFMKKRLQSNPDYSPKDNAPERDVVEFEDLYNSLRSWPIYYYGLKGGGNYSGPRVTEEFRVDNTAAGASRDYKAEPGIEIGLVAEIPIIKPAFKASIVGELIYSRQSYSFDDNVLGFANLKFDETQEWINLPLLFRYHFRRNSRRLASGEIQNFKNKFQPFLQAGVSLQYLLRAEADLSRSDDLGSLGGGSEGGGGTTRDPINGSFKLTQSNQRNPFNVSAIIGGGVRLKNFVKSGGDLLLEGRFHYAILDVVNGDERFSSAENQQRMLYDFGYIDSNFKMTSVSISLTYLLPVYKPVRLYDGPVKGIPIRFGED